MVLKISYALGLHEQGEATEVCLNQLYYGFDNWKLFVSSLITVGTKCAPRDGVRHTSAE